MQRRHYTCKICKFEGGSPFGLRDHYQEYPEHRPTAGQKAAAQREKQKRRISMKHAIHDAGPLLAATPAELRFCPCCGFDLAKIRIAIQMMKERTT